MTNTLAESFKDEFYEIAQDGCVCDAVSRQISKALWNITVYRATQVVLDRHIEPILSAFDDLFEADVD